ncbi:MAG: Rrf2 family iron-sulfur cluster assembly transcriptional regulator [Parvicella sp.]|jgi:Rrf2 family iron-sulfur cluster assembly transcriptional regulator
MKITSQVEYGLRIMVRITRCKDVKGINIRQLSEAEGLSTNYVAKLTRLLRMQGLINSTKGHMGGYLLAKPSNEITVNDALNALSGKLFDKKFCDSHAGTMSLCTNSVDCSIRSLWSMMQATIDNLLDNVTMADMMGSEKDTSILLQNIIK